MGGMARLPQRGHRALEHLRLVASDASSAGLVAQRALGVIEAAVPFDEGAIFGVDSASLVFNRLLAYRGLDRAGLHDWIRDVYLVAAEPAPMHFPTLLARGGGVACYHEDVERWLRVSPPRVSARELRRAWRMWDSPPGGALRYGLAHRRRWIAALQLARLEPGSGFRPGELEILDRAAPTLARAIAERLAPTTDAGSADPQPPPGTLTFDADRRLASLSSSAERWLTVIGDERRAGAVRAGAPTVPVVVQALVSQLAGSGAPTGRLLTQDDRGRPVAVSAERALQIDRPRRGELTSGYAVSISSAPLALHVPGLTGGQWAVAQAVARGLSDREIADAMHLAPATVHERVAALHRLLGTNTRPRLVAELAAAVQ
jgi:DNA-binding CsgD family transcriptional regulator